MDSESAPIPARLVLFDGVCGLCDSAVQWLLDHDTAARLHYAPLQGEVAQRLREQHPQIPLDLDTMVFVREGQVFLRSSAILQILRELPAPWRWVSAFRVLPSFLTDLGYRLVAATRYRLFGKLESCRLPTEGQAARFLG